MEHRDALVSEVIVVVDVTTDNAFNHIITRVTAVGLVIEASDPDTGSIEGTIFSNQLPELRAVSGVKFVRITMEYIADYPTGDPRDLDDDSP